MAMRIPLASTQVPGHALPAAVLWHSVRTLGSAFTSSSSVLAPAPAPLTSRRLLAGLELSGRRRLPEKLGNNFSAASENGLRPAAAYVETHVSDSPNANEFVEVGYIADTHGLQGELRVYSRTDFPQKRFEQPGKRWVRFKSQGRLIYKEVELLHGREVGGKRASWLITLKGFNSLEEASGLVGSTLLATERPILDEDEFYTPDLVGMSVILQETRQEIGVIVDVYNTGGETDLLQVRRTDGTSGHKIWIPFVRDIVPVVDQDQRIVEINPPAGLLELNSPVDNRERESKRKKDIKDKRKEREKFLGLKKRLVTLKQTHILEGLSSGNEDQKKNLFKQLLSTDFSVFQRALQDILPLTSRVKKEDDEPAIYPPSDYPCSRWEELYACLSEKEINKRDILRWWSDGLQMIAKGTVAVVALAGGQSTRFEDNESVVKGVVDLGLKRKKSLFKLQAERLIIVQELAKMVAKVEVNKSVPWIIMTSDATDLQTRVYFEENQFFGLEKSQVWFVKQDSMPCIDVEATDGHHRILLETPWRIAQAPNGNGGLFSALHEHGVNDRLAEYGVEYVQVYAVDNALTRVSDPVFFGYTREREADIGIKVVKKLDAAEAVGVLCRGPFTPQRERHPSFEPSSVSHKMFYNVVEYSEITESRKSATVETPSGRLLKFRAAHMCVNIFSLSALKVLGDSDKALEYHAALKRIKHVKKDGEGWFDVLPVRENGIKLEQFIFDAFKYFDPDKVAVLEVVREEEFSPLKNAVAPGRSDTIEAVRSALNGLSEKLLTLALERSEVDVIRLTLAYMGAHINANLEDILQRKF